MISLPLDNMEESEVQVYPVSHHRRHETDSTSKSEQKKKKHPPTDLLQHTPEKKKQIDYSLTFNANKVNPLIWVWNNYNLQFSVGITAVCIFSLTYVKTSKVWTEKNLL